MSYALETQAVEKTYDSHGATVRAVDNISISVRPGEFVALVGPSGSGKTTLLAILAGLLRASSGQVFIDGRDLTTLSDKHLTTFRRQNIGFTFQSNNLVPYLTALENVELMLKLNGRLDQQGKARARELLTRLGLADRMNNLSSQLSGGQRQRVAIARALIHNPAVVLADEPTASLDTERAFQVVETFANLIHEQNRAGIMVTHDLRMVKYVDKVIQMRDGQLDLIIDNPSIIAALAGSSGHDITAQPDPAPPEIAPARRQPRTANPDPRPVTFPIA